MDMDYCLKEKCIMHLGKKPPSILFDLGRSKSMTEQWDSMSLLASTLLQIHQTYQDWQQDDHICSWQVHPVLVFRYPRWVHWVHDKGGEFISSSFQSLLKMLSIKDVGSASKNSQSNAICERMHQTVGNVLRILVHTNPPQNMTKARDIIHDAFMTTMHAMHTTVATNLGSALGSLAFAWVMFLNVPLITDWQAIACLCKNHVNEKLWHANQKHFQDDYAPGQQVLKKVHHPTKLGVRTEGTYTIEHGHINGKLTIILHDRVTKCINMRRVLSYR